MLCPEWVLILTRIKNRVLCIFWLIKIIWLGYQPAWETLVKIPYWIFISFLGKIPWVSPLEWFEKFYCYFKPIYHMKRDTLLFFTLVLFNLKKNWRTRTFFVLTPLRLSIVREHSLLRKLHNQFWRLITNILLISIRYVASRNFLWRHSIVWRWFMWLSLMW